MDIVVCVKRVPLTEEVDLVIDQQKKGVKKDQLAFVLNDWDNYATSEDAWPWAPTAPSGLKQAI